MTLVWPWSLLGLTAVGAAAVWALLRPGRQLAVVATLSLWQKAVASLDRSARRRSRRVTASWVLLLLGAVLAVCAAARPVYQPSVPARRVAVALVPSAELATEAGLRELRRAARVLLGRLDAHDRVQLLLPGVLGRPAGWESVRQAEQRIAEVLPLPAVAEDLVMPAPDEAAQHVYRVVPAGLNLPAGPSVSVVEVSCEPAAATIDAFAAVPLPDGKTMQWLVAVRNQQPRPWRGRLIVSVPALAGSRRRLLLDEAVNLGPDARKQFIRDHPAAEALVAELFSAGKAVAGAGSAAFLARRSAVVRRVAMTGADEPLLRRYVRIDPTLALVADPGQADIVIANGVQPPGDKPALVINPPAPPPGRLRGEPLAAVDLTDAHTAADHPVMRDVRLAGVHVRRLRPWVRSELADDKVLASYKGDAIILCVTSTGADVARTPRRVYVAFELHTENTNFSMEDDFVVFLANAMRFLAPGGRPQAVFSHGTPIQAGDRTLRDWTPVVTPKQDPFHRERCPLVTPGLYRDAAGQHHAVSLVGLRSARARAPATDAAAAVTLPAPAAASDAVALWPVGVVAAMGLWLLGWAFRAR